MYKLQAIHFLYIHFLVINKKQQTNILSHTNTIIIILLVLSLKNGKENIDFAKKVLDVIYVRIKIFRHV